MTVGKPPPGEYVIYNRLLSCSGEKLAITYCNKGGPVTVTPLKNSKEQIWVIKNYSDGETQHVIPKKNSKEEIGWGNYGATIFTAGNYVWIIRKGNEGYTIQDGGKSAYWGVQSGNPGAKVTITKGKGPGQAGVCQTGHRWILEKVGDGY